MTIRTKADKAALARLREFLNASHPAFRGSALISATFRQLDVRLYLETWVLPLLDELDPPPPKENNDKRAADIIMGRNAAQDSYHDDGGDRRGTLGEL